MLRKEISLVTTMVMVILLSGCVLSVDKDSRTSGDRWYDSDLSFIRRGLTTSEQVASAFGDPPRRIESDQGSEIWRYTYSDKEETEVGLIFLFHINVEDETSNELNIEFRDGVVQDFWTRKY